MRHLIARSLAVAQTGKGGRAPAGSPVRAAVSWMVAATTRLATLATVSPLLAACGAAGGGGQGRPATSSRPPATTRPPVPAKVIVAPATVHAVGDIPADQARRALDKTVYLVLTQYADRLVLTGKDAGLRSQLGGTGIAQALKDHPRDRSLLAVRPLFPPSVLRLGDPVAKVVRSRFTVRERRCDFSRFCAGASRPSGLNLHWSGALAYRAGPGRGRPAWRGRLHRGDRLGVPGAAVPGQPGVRGRLPRARPGPDRRWPDPGLLFRQGLPGPAPGRQGPDQGQLRPTQGPVRCQRRTRTLPDLRTSTTPMATPSLRCGHDPQLERGRRAGTNTGFLKSRSPAG
jgi:hypothetical protein